MWGVVPLALFAVYVGEKLVRGVMWRLAGDVGVPSYGICSSVAREASALPLARKKNKKGENALSGVRRGKKVTKFARFKP